MDLQYQKKNMRAANHTVVVKRVYEKSSKEDGTRVLVDRLWPRGLTKAKAHLDAWLRDVAPSDELRKWFHEHPEARREFRRRYLHELRGESEHEALEKLYELLARADRLTLLFASKNVEYNNAVVLREIMAGAKKPPSGTRPSAARGVRMQRRRPRG